MDRTNPYRQYTNDGLLRAQRDLQSGEDAIQRMHLPEPLLGEVMSELDAKYQQIVEVMVERGIIDPIQRQEIDLADEAHHRDLMGYNDDPDSFDIQTWDCRDDRDEPLTYDDDDHEARNADRWDRKFMAGEPRY